MKDPQKQLDKFAQNKDIQKDIEYFKKNAGKFESVDALLKDRKMAKVLLSAYDLQDEINGLGRIKKVLTEDPTSSGALSARLADSRFAAMAKDLRLDQSMAKLSSASFLDKLDDKYIRSEFEQALGRQDPALRQAAYFARTVATKSASGVYGILGDKILRDVVQNTLSLPAQLAIQPVETQARAVTAKLKVDQFATELKDAGGLSSSQVKQAQQDAEILENNLQISDSAYKQVSGLQKQVDQAIADYTAYMNRTVNPANVESQQDAIPDLIKFEQMLTAGGTTVSNIATQITKLQSLVNDAGVAANSGKLDTYKTRFNTAVDSIINQLNNAGINVPTTYSESQSGGTAPVTNMFQNGSNEILTAQPEANGSKDISVNVFNTADLVASLNNAKTAFNNITSSTDIANLSTAANQVGSALARNNSMTTSIKSDLAILKDKLDDATYVAPVDSADMIKAKRSVDDALSRSSKVASLLEQISKLAEESADRVTAADRSDIQTKFEKLRTQVFDTINNSASGTDNLLTQVGKSEYTLMTRPADGGGTEDVQMYAHGAGTSIQDILNDLGSAVINTKDGAEALQIRSLQLTNRTDTATRQLNADKVAFDRVINNYDPKGKIDMVFYNIQTNLDATIEAAAKNSANLLSADQSDISFAISNSSDVQKLRAAKTFKSDVMSQLTSLFTQIGNGVSATKTAAQSLGNVLDRTARFIGADNRNLSFEQGRIGAVLDLLDTDTASDGGSIYKVNSFTEKFISRYLTLNGSNGMTFSSSQASSLTLFGGTASAGSILSLSMSI